MDLTVRCHSCAHLFEIVVPWRQWEERDDAHAWIIQPGKRATCPDCGRVHQAGEEMQVTDAQESAG